MAYPLECQPLFGTLRLKSPPNTHYRQSPLCRTPKDQGLQRDMHLSELQVSCRESPINLNDLSLSGLHL